MAIVDGAGEDGLPVKDPRTIARGYQLELCRKAVAENIIVYLETGCGKTHIAVLLIYELGHLIRKPQKSVCVFLAPTVHLVQQQAMVIEHSTHFKVGSYFGPHKHLGSPKEWEAEIQKYEVLVMTPEILLHNLHHCFMKMETIALLIFDECHHAQKRHPYAQIMKEFYRRGTNKMPRVFGLTASPVIGRGGFHQMNYSKCINTLEHLLDAKVCSVGDKEEIEQVVPSPDVRIYFYQASINSTCHFNATYISKLEEIKDKCINHVRTAGDLKDLKKKARLISQLHGSIVVCLEKLGLWTAIEAIRVLQSEDSDDIVEIMEGQSSSNDNNVGGVYLQMASSVLDLSLKKYDDQFGAFVPEALEEPFFSNKLLILIAILSTNRKQDAKCIVFVSRIITARVLAHILGRLNCLSFWKCDFLVGFHTGLKSMSRHRMKNIVDKFRSGKANLLVATNVAEEGLDIQTCCLIIRFDLPATVASYIQSRGRARMQESEYLFLVERGNDHELNLVNDFISGEEHMNSEILLRTSKETFNGMENLMYNVETTGASISTGCSISLLHHYCSRLPRDEYYNPVPEFCFFDDLHGVSCHVVLPSNAPIRRVEGPSCTSKEDAKRVASLQLCKKLHELGSLTDYLLPCQKNEIVGSSSVAALSKVEDLIDEFSGAELHEMIVPAILRVPWEESASHLVFHFYYLRFVPIPMDRCYRRFGLFLSSFLPKEVEAMQVDLHLAHSRIIKAELVPSGTITFTKAEIMDAVKFQEMCLKIMLDRSVFTADYVQLGSMDSSLLTSSTYYLLLPIKEAESIDHQLTVDWSTLRNCLSSPAFNKTVNTSKVEYIHDGIILQSATGPVAENEILNSLVFTPHNGLFFFISDIFHGINGSSRFKDKAASYAEYYLTKFNIVLKYPEQPFLKAKQLCNVHNLLRNRVEKTSGKTIASELKENFVELPPELCILKIKDFPRDIGSSLSLLPSLMHRLESILVAVELKELLSISFSEGSQVTANLVLEALTTEKCSECFSLERLEVLGDSFLKYAVSRHLFLSLETLDEGKLTEIRSSNVNNTNLYKLAIKRNLQVYIRDQCFNPSNFFAFGRPCALICDKDSESIIHSRKVTGEIENQTDSCAKKCCKNHQVLYRKTIADVVEALVGAFLVDSGFRAASAFLEWMGIPVGFDVDNVLEAWNKSRRNLTIADAVDVAPLENLLGYRFLNRGLLLQALTHASSNNSSGDCYQRLEFLGDAVVDYIITSYLYSSYPNLKPGHLTDLRALIVSNNSLGQAAARHSLHLYLLSDSVSLTDAINKFVEYAQTQASDGDLVEEPKCPKVLADLVESCAGALLLDSGFDLNLVWKFTFTILDPLEDFSSLKLNPVRELQELCQSRNMQLSFSDSMVKNTFSVQAKVNMQGTSLVGEGSNQSKRAAEKLAAIEALTKLKAHGFQHNLKSLHKIASSHRQSPALIGYDESQVIMDVSKVLSLESSSFQVVQESSSCDYTSDESFLHPSPSEVHGKGLPAIQAETVVTIDHAMQLPSAKSRLHELCSARYWEQPSFFCYKDEGPSHMKLFTYKVTVQVCGTTDTILECFSEPRNKKEDAAEHAAEGALWWLARHGYASMNFTSR